MLISFFDHKGMIYQHFVPHTTLRTTINKEYYIKVLKKLREHIQRKRPEIAKNFILHQDNALPHTAGLTRTFLAKFNVWYKRATNNGHTGSNWTAKNKFNGVTQVETNERISRMLIYITWSSADLDYGNGSGIKRFGFIIYTSRQMWVRN